MPPEALLEDIIKTVQDRFLGLEALALASICERANTTTSLEKLPTIPGLPRHAEDQGRAGARLAALLAQ